MTKILQLLYSYQDAKYADFTARLVPTLPRNQFIGVRSLDLKKIAKQIQKTESEEIEPFMNNLPHKFHEENILHSLFINNIKDFETCVLELEKFLPFVNNWAVSDGINPKVFAKNHAKLFSKIENWLNDEKPFTKRVALLLIMKHFLEKDFKPCFLQKASSIKSEEYYVNMMLAWLFAESLVKQWNVAIKFIEEKKLDKWVHNKTIQKARESFRITEEQKEYLKTLKIFDKTKTCKM